MGIRVRTSRCFEQALPRDAAYLRCSGCRSSRRLLRSLLHRSPHLLRLDRPQIRLSMDIHHRSVHLRRWCTPLLAKRDEAVLWGLLRCDVCRWLRAVYARDFCQSVHRDLRSSKVVGTSIEFGASLPGNWLGCCTVSIFKPEEKGLDLLTALVFLLPSFSSKMSIAPMAPACNQFSGCILVSPASSSSLPSFSSSLRSPKSPYVFPA